jgi:hypothetical protein
MNCSKYLSTVIYFDTEELIFITLLTLVFSFVICSTRLALVTGAILSNFNSDFSIEVSYVNRSFNNIIYFVDSRSKYIFFFFFLLLKNTRLTSSIYFAACFLRTFLLLDLSQKNMTSFQEQMVVSRKKIDSQCVNYFFEESTLAVT